VSLRLKAALRPAIRAGRDGSGTGRGM